MEMTSQVFIADVAMSTSIASFFPMTQVIS